MVSLNVVKKVVVDKPGGQFTLNEFIEALRVSEKVSFEFTEFCIRPWHVLKKRKRSMMDLESNLKWVLINRRK